MTYRTHRLHTSDLTPLAAIFLAFMMLLLIATAAYAGQYHVRFTQPEEELGDCVEIDNWELWGYRGATGTPALLVSIPQTPALCAGGEVVAPVTVNLKQGEWHFTLIAVGAGGRAESDVLTQRIPPPRPILNAITK